MSGWQKTICILSGQQNTICFMSGWQKPICFLSIELKSQAQPGIDKYELEHVFRLIHLWLNPVRVRYSNVLMVRETGDKLYKVTRSDVILLAGEQNNLIILIVENTFMKCHWLLYGEQSTIRMLSLGVTALVIPTSGLSVSFSVNASYKLPAANIYW